MCLAIPAKIKTLGENNMAEVDVMGVTRNVSLDLVPDVAIGGYVLVHAGYAIQVIDEDVANETLDLLRQLDLAEDEVAEA